MSKENEDTQADPSPKVDTTMEKIHRVVHQYRNVRDGTRTWLVKHEREIKALVFGLVLGFILAMAWDYSQWKWVKKNVDHSTDVITDLMINADIRSTQSLATVNDSLTKINSRLDNLQAGLLEVAVCLVALFAAVGFVVVLLFRRR